MLRRLMLRGFRLPKVRSTLFPAPADRGPARDHVDLDFAALCGTGTCKSLLQALDCSCASGGASSARTQKRSFREQSVLVGHLASIHKAKMYSLRRLLAGFHHWRKEFWRRFKQAWSFQEAFVLGGKIYSVAAISSVAIDQSACSFGMR